MGGGDGRYSFLTVLIGANSSEFFALQNGLATNSLFPTEDYNMIIFNCCVDLLKRSCLRLFKTVLPLLRKKFMGVP